MINVRSIPHLYRNVRRWTEIVTVLSKYGLADWLAQTNIDFAKDRLSSRDGEAIATCECCGCAPITKCWSGVLVYMQVLA